MLTIMEVSNFQPRHPAEREAEGIEGVRRVIVVADRGSWTEAHGRQLLIEHVEAPAGASDEPTLLAPRRLRELVQLHRPAAILCRSPLWVPALTHLASGRLDPRPALVGVASVDPLELGARLLGRARASGRAGLGQGLLARAGADAARIWITQTLASLDAIFVATRELGRRLWSRGLDRLYWVPPGVELERFSPARREPALVDELRAGAPRWIVSISAMALDEAARTRDALCRRARLDPALILDVPRSEARDRFVAAHPHVHVAPDPDARARLLASADLAVVLPSSAARGACAEAMACARPLVHGGGAAGSIAAASCGRVAAGDGPEAHASAAAELLRAAELDELDELGRRGRRAIEAFPRRRCVERELACLRELIALVRAGARAPAGIHERLPAPALGAAHDVDDHD